MSVREREDVDCTSARMISPHGVSYTSQIVGMAFAAWAASQTRQWGPCRKEKLIVFAPLRAVVLITARLQGSTYSKGKAYWWHPSFRRVVPDSRSVVYSVDDPGGLLDDYVKVRSRSWVHGGRTDPSADFAPSRSAADAKCHPTQRVPRTWSPATQN